VIYVYANKKQRGKNFVLNFPYNNDLIENIKSLDYDKRKFISNAGSKFWELTPFALMKLILMYKGKNNEIKFQLSDDDKKYLIDEYNKVINIHSTIEKYEHIAIKVKEYSEENYDKFKKDILSYFKEGTSLYNHQYSCINFLNFSKSALVSLDMGLGKTLISIGYCEYQKFNKILVITPNSLKINYANEINKFTKNSTYCFLKECVDKKDYEKLHNSKYIIVNYDFFRDGNFNIKEQFYKYLPENYIDCVVLDECHRIKNSKSNTHKNLKKIVKGITNKIFLSGTPAPNRVAELYYIFNFLNPLEFSSKNKFYEKYLGMKYEMGSFGYTQIIEPDYNEVYRKLSPYMYRKRKEEVINLPEKIIQNIEYDITPTERKKYDEILGDVFVTINDTVIKGGSLKITIMIELRKYVSMLKSKYITDIIESLLENDEKIVIVDYFKNTLYDLYKKYEKISVIHTGDQTVEHRANSVKRFQNDNDVRIFFGSIPTTKEGLTLTASCNMIILTLPYVVGEFDQVCDRIHRISQDRIVNIMCPVISNSIDHETFSILENKRHELYLAIDNKEYESKITSIKNISIFNTLIERIKKVEKNNGRKRE
jgi:SNF2 family DNA or RNA helicase